MAQRFLEGRVTERIQEEVERNSDIQDGSGARGRAIWRHIRSTMSFRGEREKKTREWLPNRNPPPRVIRSI